LGLLDAIGAYPTLESCRRRLALSEATNELYEGGRFVYTMAAKDQSFSFDFCGTYTRVVANEAIAFTLDDDRKVEVHFRSTPEGIEIIERFDPENVHPEDMQQAGWQMILDNFKNTRSRLGNGIN